LFHEFGELELLSTQQRMTALGEHTKRLLEHDLDLQIGSFEISYPAPEQNVEPPLAQIAVQAVSVADRDGIADAWIFLRQVPDDFRESSGPRLRCANSDFALCGVRCCSNVLNALPHLVE